MEFDHVISCLFSVNPQKVLMMHLHSKESLQWNAFSAQHVFDLWNVVHKKDLQKNSGLDLKTLYLIGS